MNDTLNYYDNNAQDFVADTKSVEFYDVQDRFIKYIPAGGFLLDFGCGSERDTKYFISRGFRVDAIDGSWEMCNLAKQTAGIDIKQMFFAELNETAKYDGIWACASILHLPRDELRDVMNKMMRATKPEGYIYTSFKYGNFEGSRNGRCFTDFTEESFAEFIKEISQLEITEMWISADVRPDRSDEKWLNVILKNVRR